MIEIKGGVRLLGVVPQMFFAASVAEGIWREQGVPLVVTGGIEGLHSEASDHYAGRALDFRTKNLAPGKAPEVVAQLKAALGEDFFILHELIGQPAEHAHVSWRPKAAY